MHALFAMLSVLYLGNVGVNQAAADSAHPWQVELNPNDIQVSFHQDTVSVKVPRREFQIHVFPGMVWDRTKKNFPYPYQYKNDAERVAEAIKSDAFGDGSHKVWVSLAVLEKLHRLGENSDKMEELRENIDHAFQDSKVLRTDSVASAPAKLDSYQRAEERYRAYLEKKRRRKEAALRAVPMNVVPASASSVPTSLAP